MPSSKSVRPPWWLQPANKGFIQMSRLLRAFPTEVPTGVGFMKRSGLVTEGTPEEFEALAGRCAVFRPEPV
jgi:hypothetical protein